MTDVLTAKDLTTDQEVRWCPGCGDFAILKAVRSTLAKIGRAPHEVVFVSGIGCAARFPFYIKTYGFHTIHGRAPSIATGVKLANPDLDVWVVGGDGDMLAIGGNHLVHTLRRDLDLNILLFNNAIYGLTKGQVSPASLPGTISPSSPRGSHDAPVNAAALAMAAGAGFVARTVDTQVAHMSNVLESAHGHHGASLVEIFQNCIVYNDMVWDGIENKVTRKDQSIMLEHGQPMIFGADGEKGLRWDGDAGVFELVEGSAEKVAAAAHIFDEGNFTQSMALVRMEGDELPTALGILYRRVRDEKSVAMEQPAKPALDQAALQKIVNGSNSWSIHKGSN